MLNRFFAKCNILKVLVSIKIWMTVLWAGMVIFSMKDFIIPKVSSHFHYWTCIWDALEAAEILNLGFKNACHKVVPKTKTIVVCLPHTLFARYG